jgi:NlpC/P60 family protein
MASMVSGEQLVQYALQFLGTPYVWGGASPSGFDCSGLMFYTYQHFGLSIPRVTFDQINAGRMVKDVGSAQAGDLVFFDSDHNGTPSHVGMYMGNGQIIVADTTGTPVRVRPLSAEDRIVGITRMPGVISTNNDFGSPGNYSNFQGLFGSSGFAQIPAARPTFDWWSAFGINSPTVADAQQSVGLITSFIQNDPDLQDLYSQAVAGNWSQDQFIAALHETDWWKNNSDTVRNSLAQKQTDPATWNQSIENDKVKILEMATKLGVHLSDSSLGNVANTAALLGWNDAMIQQSLSTYLEQSSKGWFGGYAGQVELGLKEYAADMGIPVSDKFVNDAVNQVVAGTNSLQAYRAQIQTQAASAFPAYADLINKGVTVGKIAVPFASALSQILEQNPDQVSLNSPILRQAMQATDAKGVPVQKSLTDFENELRQNPLWRKTNNARDTVMSSANQILTDMGLQVNSLGQVPQTSPNQVSSISDSVANQSKGLSGMTTFPTLQGQEALNTPHQPINAQATSLANPGFNTSGTPQGA